MSGSRKIFRMKIQAFAPTRIGLFGGGTDVAPYCELYDGLTLSMAISLYQKVILYSENDIFEIPSNLYPPNADPSLFYTIFKKYKIDGGHLTKVKSEFDGRIGAGLGSSASACVALIGAINKRKNLGMYKKDIAQASWEAEEKLMGWHGGKQDQWAASFGGLNLLSFKGNEVNRTEFSSYYAEKLSQYILLFDTGGSRKSHEIQKGFLQLTNDQIKNLHLIKLLAKRACQLLIQENFEQIGKVFHEAWLIKKQSNRGITTERIDMLYEKARNVGAVGGKVLGAGGCGYMIFWVPLDKQKDVISTLEKEECEHIYYYPDTIGLLVKEIS